MSESGSETVAEEQKPTEGEAVAPAETAAADPAEPRPEEPKTEEPKTEEPKTGELKLEEPKTEEPKTEEPKTEEPKTGEPKPEEPKTEEPKPEEPKTEEPKPPPPAPSIKTVEPDHGPLCGGVALTVTGEAFAEGCKVLVGGVEATTVREGDTSLRVETPARQEKGLVELRVVNPDGQIAVYEEDVRYDAAPVILGTEPSWLSVEGGAVVTILGADFAPGCAVHLDGVVVPSSWVNAGRVEAVSKKHDAGEVEVVVVNPDQQRAVRERAVRFAAPPVASGIEPATAFTGGGAEVRAAGRGFEAGCAVLVDGAPAQGVTFVSEAEVRFIAPAHAGVGPVDVAVVNPTGLGHRLPLALAYVEAPPRLTSVAPHRGPSSGGTEIVLRGHDFHPGALVFVCGLAARASFRSPEELLVVTPAVARDGLVDVRVVNPDDQACSVDKAFTYVAPLPPPELREVSPARGSSLGGLVVAILGADFADGATVCFGGAPAVVRFLTHKELSVTTPAVAIAGEVAVAVVNPDGASSQLEAAFTFEGLPAAEITGITPTSGPTTGGTRVTIEGNRFTRDCAVFVGREHPRDFVWKSATELAIVTAPRKQSGVVDIEVAVPGAPRAVMKNAFRYDAVPAPLITSVSPTVGAVAGGTEITVSGKNFLKETVVLVDGKAPRAVKLVDATTLELKAPPGEAGKMVDVVVRNPDGKEAVQKRAFLYDPRYRG